MPAVVDQERKQDLYDLISFLRDGCFEAYPNKTLSRYEIQKGLEVAILILEGKE